ncbi:MAG: hypothetical protein ACFCUO_12395 [Rhodospirillales bacterium]
MKRFLAPLALGVTVVLGAGAQPANALVTTNDYSFAGNFVGNDCAGALGTPPNCSYDGSPMIAKFDFNDDGTVTFTPGSFVSIDGTEFSFDIAYDAVEEEWAGTGKWTYTPGTGDPGITAFSVKGGPGYNIFDKDGQAFLEVGDFSDDWFTPNAASGNPAGLSHLVFFDSTTAVPIPGAVWLFGTGLLGLLGIGYSRRRKAAA